MAQVIMTWTREDTSKQWILINRESIDTGIFTPQEAEYFYLTRNFYSSLPGYVSLTSSYVDNKTFKVIIEFDTVENAQSAFNLLQNPAEGSVFQIRKKIISDKLAENNMEQYGFTLELV